MNIRLGGEGGWNHLTPEQMQKRNLTQSKVRIEKFKTDLEFRTKFSESIKKSHLAPRIGILFNGNHKTS